MLKVIPEDCRCVRDDKHYVDMAHIYQEYEKRVFSKFRKTLNKQKNRMPENSLKSVLYRKGI